MRLIDADAFIDDLYEHEFSNWCDKDEVSTLVNDAPSIDIVRCKECKHCNEWEQPNGIELYCNNPNVDPFDWGGSVSFYVKADDFCSYGERQTEENRLLRIGMEMERRSRR